MHLGWRVRGCHRLGNRQADGEGCAVADALAGYGDASAMEFDDRLGNRQAQTEATEALNPGGRALLEGDKERCEVLRSDPHPGVANFDAQGSFLCVEGADMDAAALSRELGGVLDHVPEDLLDAGRVSAGAEVLGICMDLKIQALLCDIFAHNVQDFEKELVDVGVLPAQRHFSAGDFGDVEQIVDQRGFQFDGIALDLPPSPA